MSKTTAINKSDNKQLTGRPTKLTPERQAKICELVAAGNYLVTACNVVDINKSTFLDWIERGEKEYNNGGGLYSDFLLAVKRAESDAETARVARVEAAGIGGGVSKRRVTTFKDGTETVEETFNSPQWLADMTHLERRHPERWGRKDRSTIQIEEHKTITITTVEVVKDYGRGQVVEGEAKEITEGNKEDV